MQLSQAIIWHEAATRLEQLAKFMLNNCMTPTDIPKETKGKFIDCFDTLEVFRNELR